MNDDHLHVCKNKDAWTLQNHLLFFEAMHSKDRPGFEDHHFIQTAYRDGTMDQAGN